MAVTAEVKLVGAAKTLSRVPMQEILDWVASSIEQFLEYEGLAENHLQEMVTNIVQALPEMQLSLALLEPDGTPVAISSLTLDDLRRKHCNVFIQLAPNDYGNWLLRTYATTAQ